MISSTEQSPDGIAPRPLEPGWRTLRELRDARPGWCSDANAAKIFEELAEIVATFHRGGRYLREFRDDTVIVGLVDEVPAVRLAPPCTAHASWEARSSNTGTRYGLHENVEALVDMMRGFRCRRLEPIVQLWTAGGASALTAEEVARRLRLPARPASKFAAQAGAAVLLLIGAIHLAEALASKPDLSAPEPFALRIKPDSTRLGVPCATNRASREVAHTTRARPRQGRRVSTTVRAFSALSTRR